MVAHPCRSLRFLGAALTLGAIGALVPTRVVAAPQATIALNGAGSTFIVPLLQGAVISSYTRAHPAVRITYNAVGSSAGIALFTAGRANFAGSDALLDATQTNLALAQCGGAQAGGVVAIPAAIGAEALFFNVPGVHTGLKFSPEVVANIFLGHVTTWSDPSIQRLNPGVALPPLAISPIHRVDGSGTTYIFTQYLAATSSAWRGRVGAGATVPWPTGAGATGSAGVVTAVRQTPGGIGYADLAYAVLANLPYASIRNVRGAFIAPSSDSATAAAASFAPSMPSDLRQIIVNATDPKAYPIAGYSYLIMCGHQADAAGHALLDFVRYETTTGQTFARQLSYGAIPGSVRALTLAALARVRQ